MVHWSAAVATFFYALFPAVCFAQDERRMVEVKQAVSTPDFGYLPTYLARAKGFFAKEGIDFKLLVVGSRVALPALMSRQIDFAVAGGTLAPSLQGAPLKSVFYTFNSSTFQFVVRPEIQEPRDLKGKTVVISTPGSSTDVATRLMLKKMGLEPGVDVNLLTSADSKARVIAMETRQAAASAINPDVAAQLVPRGFNILMSSSDVFPVPFGGMSVHEQLLRDNPDLIKRWLRVQIRALLHIRQNPDETAQIAAKELKIQPDIARGALQLLIPKVSAEDPGGFTEKSMRFLLEFAAGSLKLDPHKIQISQVTNIGLLREVQREMGIYCREGYLCK
ncbi:MAG: ABC transporter substrate-binding protein [Deltaproteobacteria bacterium]|nr:ABC transporter substrate-binding protein [Deltaproteobacteria bacterium]